jgi:hypothetical protein
VKAEKIVSMRNHGGGSSIMAINGSGYNRGQYLSAIINLRNITKKCIEEENISG